MPKGQKLSQDDCPSLLGYKNKNWYTDSEHTNAWDYNNTVTKSMILYSAGGETEDIPVSSVTLADHELTLGIKEQYSVQYIINPLKATNQNVSWSSSDSTIVSVSADGRISANKIGEARITITTEDGGQTDSCLVTVVESNPTGLSLVADTTSYTLIPGEVRRLSVSPTSQYIYDIKWTVDNTKIATVKNGIVTAKKEGTTTVTAVYGTSAVTFNINVDGTTPQNKIIQKGSKKTKITATKNIKTSVGTNKTVSVSIPANLRDPAKSVDYEILTEGVCAVSGPSFNKPDRRKASKAVFEIRPLNAGATWIIWSMEDDYGAITQAATKVIVTKPITNLAFAESEVTINAGEGRRLAVISTEDNTDIKDLIFCSNGKGVKVSKSGYVVGVIPGSKATVTVKLGKIKATIPVTVSSNSGSYLTLNKNTLEVAVSKSGVKTATLQITTPKKASQPRVIWSIVGNPEGITIDSNGKVSVKAAASPGCYVIIAAPEESSSGFNTAYCELIVK